MIQHHHHHAYIFLVIIDGIVLVHQIKKRSNTAIAPATNKIEHGNHVHQKAIENDNCGHLKQCPPIYLNTLRQLWPLKHNTYSYLCYIRRLQLLKSKWKSWHSKSVQVAILPIGTTSLEYGDRDRQKRDLPTTTARTYSIYLENVFPKWTSSQNLVKTFFRRKIIKDNRSDFEMLESPNTKWQLQTWGSEISKRRTDNETALEHEMEQTMSQVNSFLHRLELADLVHSKKKKGTMRDWSKQQAFERVYREQVGLGHVLMTKVQELLDLEDTRMRLSRSSQSIGNNTNAPGGSGQQSDSNLSQCSRYSSEIREVLHKFGDVLKVRSIEHSKIYASESNNEVGKLVRGDRDSLQLLIELLTRDNIQPVFRALPQRGASPSPSTHAASCSVFNITVEGRGPERKAARQAAATKMLERLLEDCAKQNLPSQITPFTQPQIQEAVAMVCSTEPYDEALALACADRRKPPPCYDTVPGKPRMRVTCTALGLNAQGVHADATIAKRIAAREVLLKFKQKPKY